MIRISYILRVIALAILFGGSIATILAAVTLVHAAQSQGIPANITAANNAPVFLMFGNVVMVSSFVLLAAESLDYACERKVDKLTLSRYLSSLLCVATAIVLSFLIIPPMKQMRATIHSNASTHEVWIKFHEASRIAFGIIILSSLTSLIIPAFEKNRPDAK